MANSTPRDDRSRRRLDEEAFSVQVLRYLDGSAVPQNLSELKEALATRADRRTLFVRLCRLHGELGELLAPLRIPAPQTAEVPSTARHTPPPGTSESPPGAAAPLARADAASAVSVADGAGGPGPTGPTGQEGTTSVTPPDETTEHVEGRADETTY